MIIGRVMLSKSPKLGYLTRPSGYAHFSRRVRAECPSWTVCKHEAKLQSQEFLSSLQQCLKTTSLKDYLLQLDQQSSVHTAHPRIQKIKADVDSILQQLCKSAARKDMSCSGTILPAGSFFDQTKVGHPSEFDYLYVLNERSNEFCLDPIKIHEVTRNLRICSRSKMRRKFEPHFQAQEIRSNTNHVLQHAMSHVRLPPGWQHSSGHLSHYLGVFRTGPASTFLFTYKARGSYCGPIAVDLTPVIPFEWAKISLKTKSHLARFVEGYEPTRASELSHMFKTNGICVHCMNNEYTLTMSHMEQIMLAKFPRDSPVKKLIRILKILNEQYFTITDSRSEWAKSAVKHAQSREMKRHKHNRRPSERLPSFFFSSLNEKSGHIFQTDEEFLTKFAECSIAYSKEHSKQFLLRGDNSSAPVSLYTDSVTPALLQEATGLERPLVSVSSMAIKTAILEYVVSSDPDHNENPELWTDDDIPRLIVMILGQLSHQIQKAGTYNHVLTCKVNKVLKGFYSRYHPHPQAYEHCKQYVIQNIDKVHTEFKKGI